MDQYIPTDPVSTINNVSIEVDDTDKIARRRPQVAKDTEHFDRNQDGIVQLNEFLAAGGSKEEFGKFYVNDDGVLDSKEMELRVDFAGDLVDDSDQL